MPLTLFTAAEPDYHLIADIYDPDLPGGTGTTIPRVGALVNDHGVLRQVAAIDPATHKVSYEQVAVQLQTDDGATAAAVVSYGNDIFRAYYDTRTTPARLAIDGRLVVYGTDLTAYRLLRHAGTPAQEVISRHYDADGQFVGPLVPLGRVAADQNAWFCPGGQTLASLADDELLRLEVYNSHGAVVAAAQVHTKASAILNEAPTHAPFITGLVVRASQMTAPGAFYLYEKQAVESLGLTAALRFSDGHEEPVSVDGQRCFVYGLSDFIAAYTGLRQKVMVKYYLTAEEAADPAIVANQAISSEATITVIPNELPAGSLKLSVVPLYNTNLARYVPRYYYYTTDRTTVQDVTAHVTIDEGSLDGALYGVQQSFVLRADLHAIDPVAYPDPVVHRQPVVLRLQPVAALERYTLRDAQSSPYLYGVDASNQRRPVLRYDADRQQYFIPSTVFQNQAAVLQSFYTAANPPYTAGVETAAPVPTHFLLRDPYTGAMITTAQLSLADYATPFNITGPGAANRYLGGTVLVEFVRQVDVDTTLILYGVPVDVAAGTYIA